MNLNKILFIAVVVGIMVLFTTYTIREPYAFYYSPEVTTYYDDSPPILTCDYTLLYGKQCHMENVPSGSDNMWVYRDESFFGRTVAVLYQFQLLIGLLLIVWAYFINKDKLQRMVDKWKKRTEY
jgi:hypothetical protein